MSTDTYHIPSALDARTPTIGPMSRVAALLSSGAIASAAFHQRPDDRDGGKKDGLLHECVLTFRGAAEQQTMCDDGGHRYEACGQGESLPEAAIKAMNELESHIQKAISRASKHFEWVDRTRTAFLRRVHAAAPHLPGLVLDTPADPAAP